MENLLVCAAIDEELAHLLPSLHREGPAWKGSIGRFEVVAVAVGIGPVEAALGSAAALARRPDAAIFLGSCGAFPGTGLAIGVPVVVERSVLTASDAAAGLSYIPGPAQREVRSDPELAASLANAGAPLVGAATVVAITRDAARSELLRDFTQTEVEHLEAFAFLRAAADAGIPAACVLGIANEVGPRAHEQWKTHGDAAARAAAALLLTWMR